MVNVLPDVLIPNLKVVFCGMAAGNESAQRAEYYAGPGNQFWPELHRIGLTPYELESCEFNKLPHYGIGLTDLVKTGFGMNKNIKPTKMDSFDLESKIQRYSPTLLAFNGMGPAKEYFKYVYGKKNSKLRKLFYGIQHEKIGSTRIFILPSTSRANAHWNESFWTALPSYIKG